jgi:hypothetical protein
MAKEKPCKISGQLVQNPGPTSRPKLHTNLDIGSIQSFENDQRQL